MFSTLLLVFTCWHLNADMSPNSMRSICWKWWLTIFRKWKTPLDALVNQDLEYATDRQAHKWEDNHIWKPRILLLPFATVLVILDEHSSSEFSLWLLLCSIRLRVFDGSWLNLMAPSWDLSHILQIQKQRQDRKGLSMGKLSRWQNATQFRPFLADHTVYNSQYSWWCCNHQSYQWAAQLVFNFKMKGNCCCSLGF